MDQKGSYVEHKHDTFIKQVSRVKLNMTRTHLALTYDLFVLYKRVSRVGFTGRIKFCHPYTKLTHQLIGNGKRQAFKEI